MIGWRQADVEYLHQLLGPEHFTAIAAVLGAGDPVVGAQDAAGHVRVWVREYLRFVRWRERRSGAGVVRDLRLAQAFRALGYGPRPTWVRPSPRTEDFRGIAFALWPEGVGALAVGGKRVAVPASASPAKVGRAVVRATSRWLRDTPHLNQAILDERIWQRVSPEVMVHLRVGAELRSLSVDASEMGDRDLAAHLAHARRKLAAVEDHPLRPLGVYLLGRWAKYGRPLWSPAGAMVSLVAGSGFDWGIAPLALRLNGIPLSVCAGEPHDGRCEITLAPDHRAFDGEDLGECYRFLAEEVPRCLAA